MAPGPLLHLPLPHGQVSLLAPPLGEELPHAHSQLLPCGLWVQLTGCVCSESVLPLLPCASLATTPRGLERWCGEGRQHSCSPLPAASSFPPCLSSLSTPAPEPVSLAPGSKDMAALLHTVHPWPWASMGQSLRSQGQSCMGSSREETTERTMRPRPGPSGGEDHSFWFPSHLFFSQGQNGMGAAGGKKGWES